MKRVRTKRKKTIFILFAALFALCLLLAFAKADRISAYFVDLQNRDNVVSVGNVALRIEEAGYESTSEKHSHVVPEAHIVKDPEVVNTGKNAAYVFLQVTIPKADVVTYSADGASRNAKGETKLFTVADENGNGGVNDCWTLLESDFEQKNCNQYLYVYGTDADCTSLAAGESTAKPLFSFVRCASIVEGQGLDEASQDIIIKGYAVQAENITATAPREVWAYLYDKLSGGAKAYFAASEDVVNEIDIGNSDISIIEDAEFPQTLIPGSTVRKNIAFRNEGKNPCAVRARVDFTDPGMKKIIEFDHNASDWKYNSSDGYYYYKSLLAPGSKTKWIYDHFNINGTEADMKNFDILVYAESRNCDDSSDLLSIW